MTDARVVAGHGPSTGALVDPRGYLQSRIVIYTRAIFFVFLALMLLQLTIFSVAEAPAPDFFVKPLTWVVMVGPVAVPGGIWRFCAAGPRSTAMLRALDVLGTWIPSVLLITAPLHSSVEVSDPAGGTVGIIHLSTLVGCLLVIRAAAVPSKPLTTLAVTVLCLGPCVPLAYLRWNATATFGTLSVAKTGAFSFTMVLLFFCIATTLVTRIVHRLEATARQALQLGQYTLEEKIGEGGMGEVYKARHALLRRPTAIKLLPPDRLGDAAVARFEREVQMTSRLTHPNTVAIYDFGRTAEGVFYYAMEYLDGIGLDELVERDGAQPQARVIHIIAQAADALAEAHDKSLIHRDIKPANIVLCSRGGVADTVKVLDFGLVKDVAAPKDVALTATQTITGTPQYMAPEALADPETVDGRADLYALGCVAYWLLVGENVFEGKTMVEVCSHHLHTAPEPLSARTDATIDTDLEKVVLRCLEKKPADRFATAGELRSALLACRSAGKWTRDDANDWWKTSSEPVAKAS